MAGERLTPSVVVPESPWEREWREYEENHLGREKPVIKVQVDDLQGEGEHELWSEYTEVDSLPSCDKGGHRERSVANSPNHQTHWKREQQVFPAPQEVRSGGKR